MSGFQHFLRFTGDAVALEKILRLLQSLAQTLALTTILAHSPKDVETYSLARNQFAMGRRFFRFFRFLGQFTKAIEVIGGVNERSGVLSVLQVGKYSFMGAYLGLESLTLLDITGIYPTPELTSFCVLEGNKFWLYSLICSILFHLSALFSVENYGPPPVPPKTPQSSSKDPESSARLERIRYEKEKLQANKILEKRERDRDLVKRRLVCDLLDVCIPGKVVGWIDVSGVVTGVAGASSSLIGLGEVWENLN